MPNKRKRTPADRKRTLAARAVQDENPGMKYTSALREADRRIAELMRADAAAVLDDDLDDEEPFPPAGPDYPDPAAVLASFRQPPPLPYGTVTRAAPAPAASPRQPDKGPRPRRGT
jgi:hypothetical protein